MFNKMKIYIIVTDPEKQKEKNKQLAQDPTYNTPEMKKLFEPKRGFKHKQEAFNQLLKERKIVLREHNECAGRSRQLAAIYQWTFTVCFAANQTELDEEWEQLKFEYPSATDEEIEELCIIDPIYKPCWANAVCCKFCKRWYRKSISNVNSHLRSIHINYFKVIIFFNCCIYLLVITQNVIYIKCIQNLANTDEKKEFAECFKDMNYTDLLNAEEREHQMDTMANEILSYLFDLEEVQRGHEASFGDKLREGFQQHPKSLNDFPQSFQHAIWDTLVKHSVQLGITPNRLQNRSMQSLITV